ncbi:MAG: hypothetical protein AAF667_02500 [Pseudomonadota bacterium]
MTVADDFLHRGWAQFPADADTGRWLAASGPVAMARSRNTDLRAAWLRHGGTWFAGVGVLGADPDGAVEGGPTLQGAAVSCAKAIYGDVPFDTGQVSVVYPGYPGRDPGETDAAHRFRRNRDAAHVDGLLPVGPERRRKLQEPHAFVLGIAVTEADAGASPLVVWEGSHEVIRKTFAQALHDVPRDAWSETDLTEVYQAARRRCFQECPRRALWALPGQCQLLHRLVLHGVAPWGDGAEAAEEGRAIVYFRPDFPDAAGDWLNAP